MIEELDSSRLTHGKLLFPFQLIRRLERPGGSLGKSRKRDKKPRCFPRSACGVSQPGFAICPQNGSLYGRGPTKRKSHLGFRVRRALIRMPNSGKDRAAERRSAAPAGNRNAARNPWAAAAFWLDPR